MAASDLTVTVQVDGGLLAEDQATWDVLTSAFVTEVPDPERVELIITDRYEQIAGELAMLSPVRANEEMTATDYRADKPDGALPSLGPSHCQTIEWLWSSRPAWPESPRVSP